MFAMFLLGLIYHSTQTSLPKLFEQRHGGLAGKGTFGIGLLVGAVYTVAAITGRTDGFYWVYVLLAAFALCAFCAALLLSCARGVPLAQPSRSLKEGARGPA